jgi:hypothetical protein
LEQQNLPNFEYEVEQFYKRFDKSEVMPPLLAHYTDAATLAQMLVDDTLWLSNPLFMNDTQEISRGILKGTEMLRYFEVVKKVFESDSHHDLFCKEYLEVQSKDQNDGVIDTYVACFTEHTQEEQEHGRLSMWRAYGANGDGAALGCGLIKS